MAKLIIGLKGKYIIKEANENKDRKWFIKGLATKNIVFINA